MTTEPGQSYLDTRPIGSRTLMCTPVRYSISPLLSTLSISLRGVLHREAVSIIFKVFGMTGPPGWIRN